MEERQEVLDRVLEKLETLKQLRARKDELVKENAKNTDELGNEDITKE